MCLAKRMMMRRNGRKGRTANKRRVGKERTDKKMCSGMNRRILKGVFVEWMKWEGKTKDLTKNGKKKGKGRNVENLKEEGTCEGE